MDEPCQGYGELRVEMVTINSFDFTKVKHLQRFAVPQTVTVPE